MAGLQIPLQLLAKLLAIDARHHDVADEDVGMVAVGQLYRLLSVACQDNFLEEGGKRFF